MPSLNLYYHVLGLEIEIEIDGASIPLPPAMTFTAQSTPTQAGTTAPPGVGGEWNAVVWAPALSLFAAVSGTRGGIQPSGVMTSPNGVNWTLRTVPVGANNVMWKDITWVPALGLFVAVGVGGKIMTSPDGITWTMRGTPTGDQAYQTVAWSPDLALLVALPIADAFPRVTTSSDGINWTDRLTPSGASASYRSLAWSPSLGLFAAVASTSPGGGGANQVLTSPNGINWTIRTTPAGTYDWYGVSWSPTLNLFAAVHASGPTNNRVMTSPDGIAWTLRHLTADAAGWQDIAWVPTRNFFLASGYTGAPVNIMGSTDGINWTGYPGAAYAPITDVAWSPELDLAVFISDQNPNQQVLIGDPA